MKKLLTALSVLVSISGAAHGEVSGVEAYGLLDLGIASLDHSKPFDPSLGTVPLTNKFATDRVTSLVSGSFQTSRVGFRGREDLGNGASAFFVLESHINANNGMLGAGAASTGDKAGTYQVVDSSCAGQLFCRQAVVGLKGNFGTLGLGRQYAFTYDVISAYDPFIASNSFDGAGAIQQGGGNTRDVRINNSVKYTAKIFDMNVGAEYSAGGSADSLPTGAFKGVNLGYEAGALGIQAVWQKRIDSPIWSASAPSVNTIYDTDTRTFLLAAKYRFDGLTLHGGYQQINFSTGSNNLCVSQNIFVCGANSRYDGKRTRLLFGGVTYALTNRLNVIAGTYELHQFAFQTGATSQAEGYQRDFSLLVDYQLSKRSDLYAGIHHTGLYGGNSYGYANTSFNLIAAGIKHLF